MTSKALPWIMPYAFEGPDGVSLFDSGYGTPEASEWLTQQLHGIGYQPGSELAASHGERRQVHVQLEPGEFRVALAVLGNRQLVFDVIGERGEDVVVVVTAECGEAHAPSFGTMTQRQVQRGRPFWTQRGVADLEPLHRQVRPIGE